MNWHKLVIAACAGVSISSAAIAQPMSVADRYRGEWSGFYVGVNGGGMDFTTRGNFAPNFPQSSWMTDRKETGIGGLHGGFQSQWGNFIVGIEGAWDAAFGSGYGSTPGVSAGNCDLGPSQACQARINDIIQVGPRVGFAMNQWMVYGTAGYARAEIDSNLIDTGHVFSRSSAHHDGWYAGGGIEMLVSHGFVIGVEYKHFDFRSTEQSVPGTPQDSRKIKADADAVLLRLTIKQ